MQELMLPVPADCEWSDRYQWMWLPKEPEYEAAAVTAAADVSMTAASKNRVSPAPRKHTPTRISHTPQQQQQQQAPARREKRHFTVSSALLGGVILPSTSTTETTTAATGESHTAAEREAAPAALAAAGR
eukprot:413-Heterococcus_DN1.PRE.1